MTEIDSNIGPDKGKQTGPKKKWKQHDPKIKLEAVMLLYRDNKDPHIAVDILEGKGIRITISTLHRWRRQFLANAHRAFESSASTIPKGLDNNITYAQSDAKQTGEQGKDNILRGVSP